MQNHAYLEAYLASNPSFASSLLRSNPHAMQGGASSALGNPSNAISASSFCNELSAARSSVLLTEFLRHQQIEKQQKALIAQHVAALTGSTAPVTENVILLALLRKKQQQDQQALQQKQLQELQACMALAPLLEAAPHQQRSHQGHYLTTAVDASSEALAAAGLTGLAKAAAAQQNIDGNAARTEHILQQAILSLPPDRRRKGRTGKFPQKLHQMLSDLEQQGRNDIASFMSHGRAFAIHKPIAFAKEVMSKYFRMSRFSSFQRQLNLYDFQRITDGNDKGAYYVSAKLRLRLWSLSVSCYYASV